MTAEERFTRSRARFWTLVIKPESTDGCWHWAGTENGRGYGKIWFLGRQWLAHRLAYEFLIGPLNGHPLDHLCRNRICVNPAHLEPVSILVNVLRGFAPSAQNARKTHCHRGHEFSLENTRRAERRGRPTRHCRTCDRERFRRVRAEARQIARAL